MSCTGSTSCRPTCWGAEASLLATQNMFCWKTLLLLQYHFSRAIFAVSGYVASIKYI